MPVRLSEAFEMACARYRDVGFDCLSEIERMLVAIWALEADVNNGGFHQYYFNSSGDTACYAPAALRAIGAPIMAGIVDKANSLFGPIGPPVSRDERQQALSALTEQMWDDLDRQFYEYPEDISWLLEQFLEGR
jgi:uncharacterized protein DUF4375